MEQVLTIEVFGKSVKIFVHMNMLHTFSGSGGGGGGGPFGDSGGKYKFAYECILPKTKTKKKKWNLKKQWGNVAKN